MLVSTDEIVMLRFSQRNGSFHIAITATSSGTPSESLAHSSTTSPASRLAALMDGYTAANAAITKDGVKQATPAIIAMPEQ